MLAAVSSCNPGTQTHLVAHPLRYTQMELQHMFLECGSDAQGLDAFFRVSRDLPAFTRPTPLVLEVLTTVLYQ